MNFAVNFLLNTSSGHIQYFDFECKQVSICRMVQNYAFHILTLQMCVKINNFLYVSLGTLLFRVNQVQSYTCVRKITTLCRNSFIYHPFYLRFLMQRSSIRSASRISMIAISTSMKLILAASSIFPSPIVGRRLSFLFLTSALGVRGTRHRTE